jgi:predicted dinucleotide-binding enzyme
LIDRYKTGNVRRVTEDGVYRTVGIIGAGEVGRALAAHAARAGLPVLLGSRRGPDALADVIAGLPPGVTAATVDRVAAADLVILAIPFVNVPELAEVVDDWGGRVVVDATNQFARHEPDYGGYVDLGEDTGTEWVGRHLPGATMIKAFNAMFATFIGPDPRHAEGRQGVFYAGDDEVANAGFTDFLTALGFAPIHVGGLRDGGRLMQLGGVLSAVHVLRQD